MQVTHHGLIRSPYPPRNNAARIVRALFALGLVVFAVQANAATRYVVAASYGCADSSPPGGGLNESAQVYVGCFSDWFVTGPGGGDVISHSTMEFSNVVAINASGQVTGVVPDYVSVGSRSFVTGPGGAAPRYISLRDHVTEPLGINDSGQVLGASYLPNQRVISSYWIADGIGEPTYFTDPSSIDFASFGTFQPEVVNPGTTLEITSAANRNGQRTGGIRGAPNHAFASDASGAIVDLHPLLGNVDSSWGVDINIGGDVLGQKYELTGYIDPGGSPTYRESSPFLYKDGQMFDLNALLGNGVAVQRAIAMNDSGWILATDSSPQLFLLAPVPEASECAMLLAGLMLVGVAARRRRLAQAEL